MSSVHQQILYCCRYCINDIQKKKIKVGLPAFVLNTETTSVADPDPGSGAFLTLDPDPGSGIRDPESGIRNPGSEIGFFPDP
jgi:hypothetical protein